MAIGRNESIAALYAVTTGKKAADITASELEKWMKLDTDVTLETINASMLKAEGALTFPANNVELLKSTFEAVFGYAPDENATGFQYWVDELNTNAYINADTLAIALINGASTADAALVTASASPIVATYDAAQDTSVTETHMLTSSTDMMTATGDSVDNFKAYIQQNSFSGGVSNSLSTADHLDGGAGADTLHAQLVEEFIGTDNNNTGIDVMPTTKGIETVTFEALDNNNAAGAVITVDAKHMTGIDKIGSSYSDGDLRIENLTTLTDAGEIRKPGDLTITMDHTDNFDSDTDASDLTVLFDEDYLVTSTTTQGSSLTVKINNVLNIKEGTNPVENFTGISFKVGTTDVNVDITGSTSYDDVVTKINDQLTAQGLTSVSAAKGALENVYFSMTIGGYAANTLAGTFYPIVISNSGSETLTKDQITIAQGQTDGDINNTWETTPATQSTQPTSIDVELTKVGRDGEGGNLIIGGKDQNSNGDSDVDQHDGIEIFNISVEGSNDQPSNLGLITSTNNSLTTVNVKDGASWSGAELTVRDRLGEGQELTKIDATKFSGDFSLAMSAVDSQQAVESYFGIGNDSYDWKSVEDDATSSSKAYKIDMGSGNDTVTANLDGDSVDAHGESFSLVTGSGTDIVTMSMDAAAAGAAYGVSQTTMKHLANMSIDTGAGADTINLDTYGNFNITAGADSDFVRINSVDANGNAATGFFTVGTSTGVQTWGGTASEGRVLYHATLTVNFAGIESTVEVATTAANNFVATQVDINNAIKSAISSNQELAKLVKATETTGTQQLKIESLVGGDNDISIDVFQPKLIATGTAATGEYLIASNDVSALRKGILSTDAFDATSTYTSADLETAAEIADQMDDAGEAFFGSVAQNGQANEDNSYLLSTNSTSKTTAALNATGAYNYVLDQDLGTDATTDVNFSTINLGDGDHDLLVVHSNDLSMNTIVIDGSFGKDTVVNFFDIAPTMANADKNNVGLHQLDFTSILSNQVDVSTATGTNANNNDSAKAITVTLHDAANTFTANATATNDSLAVANGVNVLHYNETVTNSVKFDDLTADQLKTKLNDQAGTDTTVVGGITEASLTISEYGTTLVGTTQNHIIMVENTQNLGEYKVFSATSTLDSTDKTKLANGDVDDFTSVALLGTLDFGHSINFNLAGDATSAAALTALIDSSDHGTAVTVDGVATAVSTTGADTTGTSTGGGTTGGTGTTTGTTDAVAVSAAGTDDANTNAAGTTGVDSTYTFASGTYDYTISNFDTDDVIVFPTTGATAYSNPSGADNAVLTWNDGSTIINVNFTGLVNEDNYLFASSFTDAAV